MTILANNYLVVHKYMSSIASNPKLNLNEAQKKTFQEVLSDTSKELYQEYAKSNASSTENNAIWKSVGAAGMGSIGYSDLLMSSIYDSSGSNPFNPLYGLNQSINPNTFGSNSSNYLSNFYKIPATNNSSNYSYSTIYDRLNTLQNRW